MSTREDQWTTFSRSLILAWRGDSSVYDRGSSSDVQRLEELWTDMDEALSQGRADEAMALLFGYYSLEEPDRTPGPGVSGEGSQQGDT
jgi:hypothetical protein